MVNTRRTIVAVLIASIVMGMIEMIYEAVAGDGFWSPITYIGATVLRGLQSLQPPVGFNFWGVLLGLMGHMMNSVILTWIFSSLIARRIGSRGSLLVTGAIYGLVVFFVMWYVVVPAVDAVMLNLNATVFALAHVAWGAVLLRCCPSPRRCPAPRLSEPPPYRSGLRRSDPAGGVFGSVVPLTFARSVRRYR